MDRVTKEARSKMMAAVKPKNTLPEIYVRRVLFNNGIRFRLHRKELPGKPDLFLLKSQIAVFVNGCFWHMHEGCSRASIPKSNVSFWTDKLSKNVERDKKNIAALKDQGVLPLVVWQCELNKEPAQVIDKIVEAHFRRHSPN